MAKCDQLIGLFLMGMVLGVAYATDPNQLQDFCVAADPPSQGLRVNGLFCKKLEDVKPQDFLFRGLNVATNTTNKLGENGTLVSAAKLPGLNTLGMSLARIDYAPHGVIPPHTHPRATEVLLVLQGKVNASFITSDLPNNGGNKHFSQVLEAGDVFVSLQGLIHFQQNVGNIPAVAIIAFSSQNPGSINVANAVFGSKPNISMEMLSKTFNVNSSVIQNLVSSQVSVGVGGSFL